MTCAIIEKDGLYLVAQRSATMSHPLKWEFPGGKMEEGESADACIIREIGEELGIKIIPIEKWESVIHSYQDKRLELIPFLCSLPEDQPEARPHEHAEVRWCRLAEMASMDWSDADLFILQALFTKEKRF